MINNFLDVAKRIYEVKAGEVDAVEAVNDAMSMENQKRSADQQLTIEQVAKMIGILECEVTQFKLLLEILS